MASTFDKIRNRNGGTATQEKSEPSHSSFDAIRNRSTEIITQEPEKTSAVRNASSDFIKNVDPTKKLLTKKEEPKKVTTKLDNPITAITKVKEQKDALQKMGAASTRSVMVDKAKKDEETGRNLPVIGTALRGLDKLAEVTKPFADVAQTLYTPGGGLSAINSATRGVGSLISRLAPRIGNGAGLLPRVATSAIEEAATGAPLAVGNALARNPEASNKELLDSAAFGAGGGVIAGAAGPLVKAGAQKGAQLLGGNKANAIGPDVPKATQAVMRSMDGVPVNSTQRDLKKTYKLDELYKSEEVADKKIDDFSAEMDNKYGKDITDGWSLIDNMRYKWLDSETISAYANRSDFEKKNPGVFRTGTTDPTPVTPSGLITQPFEASKPSGSLAGDIKDAFTEAPDSGFSAFARRGNEYERSALNDTKSQLVTKTTKETMTPGEAVQSGYRKIVDDFYRFKDFDELAKRTLGRELKPSEQSHTLALNSRGADMTTRHALTENMIDINGNVTGQSLKNASQQIPKKKMIDFEDYQVLKHALWRMQRGEKVYRQELGMDLDKVAQKVFDYETKFPQFKGINEEFLKYSEGLTKNWLVDTGVLDRKTLDGYLENNPFYTPNMRQFSDIEKGSRGRARSGFSQGNPIKKAAGSERKIISPIESRIEQTDQYIKVGKRNQVLQTVVSMAEKDPEAFEGFIELLPMTDNMKFGELNKINEIIARDGVDGLVDNMNNAFDQMFTASKQAGRKDLDNVLSVMIDGKPQHVKINDAPFLEALTAMTPQAQGVILETARQATRVMKLLTTGVNPIFSLTRNLVRDIPMSYVASKTTDNPIRFAWDLADSVVKILGNKDLYKSFKAMGGGHSSSIAADRNLLAQSKAAVLPQRHRLKNIPGKILGAVENFTNALETAPRLGEYKRITKAGNNSPDSKIAGVFAANDVTVNFKRRGNVGREIDAFLPYFNAAIQGLDKTFRTFKDRPLAASLKAIGAVTVPTLFTFALNYNDPDYKKLDNRTKDLYYLLPNGDGTFTKLPKPREAGTVFGSGIERVLRKWLQDDPKAFEGFAENVRVAFSPPGVSGLTTPGLTVPERLEAGTVGDSILGPLSDIRSNKDFANRPIVPAGMEGTSPELQYDERTSKVSKWLGEKLNSSPKQLDYLLKSYTGVIGQLGIPLNNESGSIKNVLKQQVTADPTYSNGVSTEFYNNKNKLDTAFKDFNQSGERSPDFNDPLRKYFDKVSGDMSEVRKASKAIQDSKTIPTKEKEVRLKDLQIILNSLGENANQVARDAATSMQRNNK